MADTESSIAIQDEEGENTASIITCSENITINGIVALNPDGSSINSGGEGQNDGEGE